MTRQKSLNLIAYLTMASLGAYLSAYQNALPAISGEFALGGRASGIIVSLHFVASLVFPLVLGPLADRVGRRPVLVGCFALMLGGVLLVTLSPAAAVLGAGIFAVGGAFCVVEGSFSSLLAEINPGREDAVMNLSQMYFCAGAVAGPLVGRAAAALGLGWRGGFYIVLALFALCMVLTALSKLPPPHRDGSPRREDAPKHEAASKPAAPVSDGSTAPIPASGGASATRPRFRFRPGGYYLVLVAAMFIYVAVEEGAAFWTAGFVESSLGGSAVPAYFLSAFWLGMGLGRLAASFMGRAVHVFALGGIAASLAALAGVLALPGAAVTLFCFFAAGAGIAPVWPLIMSRAAVALPGSPDAAAGGVMSAGAVGAVIAPALIGGLSDVFGIRTSFAAVPIMLAVLFALQIVVSGGFLAKKR